jgi:Nucleotidyltransferase domain
MQEPNERRLALARRMASICATYPGVRAIALTGSVARGEADEASDIDLLLYYNTLPAEEELQATRAQVGGSERIFFVGDPKEGSFVESYTVDGVKHDFAHVTIPTWERDMAEVLEQHHCDSPMQKALAGLLDALPLYGTELIEAWKARAARYPDALAEAMVKRHLRFYPLWVPERHAADRDDLLFLYEILTEAERNVLGVLMGLNRVYHWGEYKRMDSFLARLPIAPNDLSARLKAILRAEPNAAVQQLGTLIDETFALVEMHMPQVNVAEARQRYRRTDGG